MSQRIISTEMKLEEVIMAYLKTMIGDEPVRKADNQDEIEVDIARSLLLYCA
jgi:hypothetical protein